MPRNNIDVILRLLNGRRFQSQVSAAGRDVRQFGESVTDAARASSGLESAVLGSQAALYGVGTAARIASLGVAAAFAAISYEGVQFNATMEQTNLAFEQFAGGASGSKVLVQELFDIAKNTPFAFTDITEAGRRLLAVGFEASETTDILRKMGDALSYTGGGADEVARLVKVFGDIRSKGRLMQQEMNQLTNLGIDTQAIRDELQLTEEQIKNLGKSGIDSETAISAILSVFTQKYGGGSVKYMQTFNGQLQRLKDNFAQASGAATKDSIFAPLKTGLTEVNDLFEDPKSVDKFKKIFESVASVIGGVVVGAFTLGKEVFTQFMGAIAPAKPFFESVLLPLLKGVGIALGGTIVAGFYLLIGAVRIASEILGALGEAFEWVDDNIFPVKKALTGIGAVLGFIFGGWMIKGIAMIGKLGFGFRLLGAAVSAALIPYKLAFAGFSLFGRLIGNLVGRIPRLSGALSSVSGAFSRLGSSIVGKIDYAFTVVTSKLGNFGVQAYKVGSEIGTKFVNGFRSAFNAILGVLAAVPAWFSDIGQGIRNWLNDKTLFGDRISILGRGVTIPALATGGQITYGGMALVGERGPEIVTLPRGSAVYPNGTMPVGASVAPLPGRSGGKTGQTGTGARGATFESTALTVVSPIYIDKRQIGEAVGEYVATKKARR